jgi:hypothetical protein
VRERRDSPNGYDLPPARFVARNSAATEAILCVGGRQRAPRRSQVRDSSCAFHGGDREADDSDDQQADDKNYPPALDREDNRARALAVGGELHDVRKSATRRAPFTPAIGRPTIAARRSTGRRFVRLSRRRSRGGRATDWIALPAPREANARSVVGPPAAWRSRNRLDRASRTTRSNARSVVGCRPRGGRVAIERHFG